jgi:hypothetical protein
MASSNEKNRRVDSLTGSSEKPLWGQVEGIGKGTKATYDPSKKTLTFCFNRGPEVTSSILQASREQLMKQLKELGYPSAMKYNGEVNVENVEEENLVVANKNHKVIIHLNPKQQEAKKE